MSEPLEVEVVAIDGAPPPKPQQPRPETRAEWFRFDRRFARPSRGSTFLGGLLAAILAVILLVFGLIALTLVLGLKAIGGLARALFPGSRPAGSLSKRF